MSAAIRKIYVGLPEVAQLVDPGETTIQKMVTKEEFPAPRLLTGRRVGWLMREVEAWAESRPISDLPPPANTGKRRPTSSEPQDVHQAA